VVRLFHTNQFVVATCFDTAKVGTFTSLPEHYAEWKTPLCREGAGRSAPWDSELQSGKGAR